jgi:putative ABC transport system permease protein
MFRFLRWSRERREIREELEFHVDMAAAKNEAAGMPPDDARRAALLSLGGMDGWQEAGRDELPGARLEDLWRDLRFAARSLSARPLFAVSATLTLGLAIAASVTAFAFANALFLRPLHAPAANRLAHIYIEGNNGRQISVGSAAVSLLREHRELFDDVAAEACCWVKFIRERGALQQRYTAYASDDFFPMLGLVPHLGRFFAPDETKTPGRDPVAVISYALWRSAFGMDPHIVGEHIEIVGRTFTIVGVGPEGFDGGGLGDPPTQVWLPTTMMSAIGLGCKTPIPCDDADALVRLAPGVSAERVRTAMATLAPTLSRLSIGDDSVRRIDVARASGAPVARQRQYAPLARLLGAIAGLLLLIAFANLGGLMLARGVAREREIALRLSLGASRWRIVRQLLSESALIAVAGGISGSMLSLWTARIFGGVLTASSEGFESMFPIAFDVRTFAFAVGTSAVATIAFGLLPAVATARANAADVLKSSSGGSPRARGRFGLIALQIALTSTLLCGAALLSRSFAHLLHEQQFDSTDVVLLRVRPQAARYEPDRAQRYVRAVRDRLAAVPGVNSVAFARGWGFVWGGSPAEAAVGVSTGDTSLHVEAHFTSPDFFATLRIPLLAGREFDNADIVGAPPVAVVSRSLAHRLWPAGAPVGRTIYAQGKPFSVVGVVPDYQIHMAGDATPLMLFFPFWQNALGPEGDARFAIRVDRRASDMLSTLRRAAVEVDRGVPVAEVMTMSKQIDTSYPEIRLGQTMLIAAGALALLLCAIGLYGTIAFVVARRTREIGIRLALGADGRRVVVELVGQGGRTTVVGLAGGLAGAFATSRFLGSWLVGVPPHDWVAFVLAAVTVVIVSCIACALPARRAARIDPVRALRVE